VPFRRLTERGLREELAARAPGLESEQATAVARVAGGRLDRLERLLDPHAARRRETLLSVARSVYLDDDFDASAAAAQVLAGAAERADEAVEAAPERPDLPPREEEQRRKRIARGAEREEILAALEELAAWYRDLIAVEVGAEGAVIHYDRLADLRADAPRAGAERGCELVRETWRGFEELNLTPGLALEALFVELRRALTG
jgi:DNA polymerase-3 subunit delta'